MKNTSFAGEERQEQQNDNQRNNDDDNEQKEEVRNVDAGPSVRQS